MTEAATDKSPRATERGETPQRAEVSRGQIPVKLSDGSMHERLGRLMRKAFREVTARAEESGESLRVAAFELGIERVVEAASTRGYIS